MKIWKAPQTNDTKAWKKESPTVKEWPEMFYALFLEKKQQSLQG